MLHTKFRENRPAGSGEDLLVVFTIYWRGVHLGHVILISRSNFRSPHPWMLHIKFQCDWPSGCQVSDCNNFQKIHIFHFFPM